MKFCAAQRQRSFISNCRRERMFVSRDNMRFRLPGRKNNGYTWLKVGDDIVSDPAFLCKVWSCHFEELAKSKLDSHSYLTKQENLVESLTVQPAENEEYLLALHSPWKK